MSGEIVGKSAAKSPKNALVLAFLSTFLLVKGVAAQENKMEQAKTLFSVGAQAFSTGQYQAAVQAFEEAYKLVPRPGLLFSLAQAQRRLYLVERRGAVLQSAIRNYRAYLVDSEVGGRKAEATEALAELEAIASRIEPETSAAEGPKVASQTRLMVSSSAEGAQVWLDGNRMSEAPLIAELSPGKHKVKVSAPGYVDEEREIVAAEGGLAALDFPLRERLARLTLQAPSGARVTLDGRAIGETPLAPLELSSGTHVIALVSNGREPFSAEFVLNRGQAEQLVAPLPMSKQRKVSYALLGTGTATLLAGTVLSLMAYERQAKAQDVAFAREQGNIAGISLAEHNSAIESRDKLRLGAFVSLGIGAVVTASGLATYLFDEPSVSSAVRSGRGEVAPKKPKGGFEISAGPGSGLAGASVSGEF